MKKKEAHAMNRDKKRRRRATELEAMASARSHPAFLARFDSIVKARADAEKSGDQEQAEKERGWILAPHLALLNRKLVALARGEIKRLLVTMPPRHGKALQIDTPIMTTKGWKRHIELAPGDEVFSPCGSPIKVIANTLAFADETYKIEFSDHQTIIAGQAHEWDVLADRDCRKIECIDAGLPRGHRHEERLETKDLSREYIRRRHQIPICSPIQLPGKDLIVDPYLLGCWLGDGHNDMGYIFCGKEDIDHFSELGEVSEERDGYYRILIRGLKVKLRSMGVLKNKHIPDEYLNGSIVQRQLLLQGLMDTDGYCSTAGQCEFCTTNESLAHGTMELVQGLGFKATMISGTATLYGKDCGPKYRILFTPDINCPVFTLPRKRLRQVNTGTQATRRTISGVSAAGVMQVNCIQVEGGVYLAGRNLVATHNSELCSKYFPAWYLGNYPNRKVILASYEARFAASWGRKARDVLEEHGESFFGDVRISQDTKAAHEWLIEGKAGGMFTSGAGGALTGKGAQLFIIDDPIKNPETANSRVHRDRVWDWYRAVTHTRLEPDASILLILTRWHEDDIAGRLLREQDADGEQWEILNLPAFAEDDDALGRAPGEALWPGRFPKKELEKKKSVMGSYWWSALYQQRPQPAGGALFKRQNFRYFRSREINGEWVMDLLNDEGATTTIFASRCLWFQAIDTALKAQQQNDYTVILTCALSPSGDLLIYDCLRERIEVPLQEGVIDAQRERFPFTMGFQAIEEAASGTGLAQAFAMKGKPLAPYRAESELWLRAQPLATVYQNGKVFHRAGASWVVDYEDEMIGFPSAPHDDIVAAAALAAIVARDRAGVTASTIGYGNTGGYVSAKPGR